MPLYKYYCKWYNVTIVLKARGGGGDLHGRGQEDDALPLHHVHHLTFEPDVVPVIFIRRLLVQASTTFLI